MSLITQAPVATVLDRIFAESDAVWQGDGSVAALWSAMSEEEQRRLMQSRTEYAAFYGRLASAPLAVSRETGRLLYMLVRSLRARTIVEFGTSYGASTLHLAAGLRENGGGQLITTEFEPSKVARAQGNLVAAGLADLVEVRAGDALTTLADGIPGEVDLLLLDGAKGLYADVLCLVEPYLRPGALIVADDADHCPAYLARVRSPAAGYLSVPFAEDIELSMKLG